MGERDGKQPLKRAKNLGLRRVDCHSILQRVQLQPSAPWWEMYKQNFKNTLTEASLTD